MVFSVVNKAGKKFYLHKRDVVFDQGGSFPNYYFSACREDNVVYEFPEGYEIIEDDDSGLPIIRKIKSIDE